MTTAKAGKKRRAVSGLISLRRLDFAAEDDFEASDSPETKVIAFSGTVFKVDAVTIRKLPSPGFRQSASFRNSEIRLSICRANLRQLIGDPWNCKPKLARLSLYKAQAPHK